MKQLMVGVLILVLSGCSHSQVDRKQGALLQKEVWPEALKEVSLDTLIAFDPKFRFQMVYTPIIEGEFGETYSFQTENYYYPASLVKIPTALVALEKMERLGITLDDILVLDTSETCGSVKFVELSRSKKITFRQMFTELLVVSDNHFYNALYHFVTPEELNKRLKELGHDGTHIYRAFTGCDKIQQLHTFPYEVRTQKGGLRYEAKDVWMDSSELNNAYTYTENRWFGSHHENAEGDIVQGPYDMNFMPELPLLELQKMMQALILPNAVEEHLRWSISEEHRTFIMELMQKVPSEIRSCHRDLSKWENNTYKYAVPSIDGERSSRTYSKLGLSYGFASETVYVKSPNGKGDFLLSYSVYVNENDTVNDGKYEYEEVARPFAEKLIDAFILFQSSQIENQD